MFTIERITSSSEASLTDINELLMQLRSNPGEPLGTQADLDAIASDKKIIFIAAKDGDKTIGMATCYLAVRFGKVVGFVEDVVVSGEYRGQGLGGRLMQKLVEEAREVGATELSLTSRQEREAANKLYQKLGFEKRETNVYRLKL